MVFPDSVAAPGFIVNRHGENGGHRTHSVEEPVPTLTTRGAGYLVQAQPEPFIQANRNHNRPKSLNDPVPVITTSHGGCIFLSGARIEPFTLGQQSGAAPRSADDPVATIAGAGAISLTSPSIIEYYGDIRDRGIDAPVSTITQRIKHALVNPHLVQYYGNGMAADIDEPLRTVTARGRKQGLANPVMVEYYGNSDAASVEAPVPTVTTKARHGLATPFAVEVNHQDGSDNRVRSIDEPLSTLTSKRGIGLAESVLVQTGHTTANGIHARSTDQPMPTLVTKNDLTLTIPVAERLFGEMEASGVDPRRLVIIDGHPFILDIRFRMLKNSELARAMGFDDDESSYEFFGTVADVTKQIGNAVPVRLAAALVGAILGQDPDE